ISAIELWLRSTKSHYSGSGILFPPHYVRRRKKMTRLAITRKTLIPLFAKSGNVCAFPGCTHELVTARNLFVGQICHIEAANPGGQRYNPNSTDEERRSDRQNVVEGKEV